MEETAYSGWRPCLPPHSLWDTVASMINRSPAGLRSAPFIVRSNCGRGGAKARGNFVAQSKLLGNASVDFLARSPGQFGRPLCCPNAERPQYRSAAPPVVDPPPPVHSAGLAADAPPAPLNISPRLARGPATPSPTALPPYATKFLMIVPGTACLEETPGARVLLAPIQKPGRPGC